MQTLQRDSVSIPRMNSLGLQVWGHLGQSREMIWSLKGKAGGGGTKGSSREPWSCQSGPGLEARFPARRREERGCGPVTGKDRASCQSAHVQNRFSHV